VLVEGHDCILKIASLSISWKSFILNTTFLYRSGWSPALKIITLFVGFFSIESHFGHVSQMGQTRSSEKVVIESYDNQTNFPIYQRVIMTQKAVNLVT